ncbi:MAG TPA: DUF4839 domain-containing protein [Candidatus Blautia stercoravium]|nr:DUF4839 domain-containing protein [Candidatus Blautia stercoravium]
MLKCSKCGAELSDDTRFCSYCGNKIEETTTPPIIEEDETIPDIPQNEPVKAEVKKSDAPKSVADKMKDKTSEKWHKLSPYGKITTVAMIAFVLLCLVAFLFGKTAAGIIAILQIVLTVVAVLIKKQIIKAPKRWLHIIALALAAVLLVPYVSLFGTDYGDAEKFAWSDILLADVIPEPKSHLGEILANSETHLSLYVYKTNTGDYSKYVDACEEKGFTVEADRSDLSYYAYNADGYKLSLYYDENDSKMSINVDAAEEYGTLEWPDSVIASMLPVPKSTTGEITRDDEKGFAAYVSNTPIEEFNAYVEACSAAGFNIDASDYDESYSAENSEGYKLSVSYQGNGVISISIDEPEYAVSLEIECVENLLFSKYDVDVYVNDSMQGTVSHGTTETYNLNLTKDVYEVKFVSAEDDEVTGGVSIDIHQDESLKYKISCTSSQINVETIQGTGLAHGEDEAAIPRSASSYKYENYTDVQTELSEAGFTNISFEILYDIVIGWTEEGEVDSVSVGGNTEFEQGDIFKKDVAIVITYHMPEEDDPNKPTESEVSSATEGPTTEPAENLTVENCPDLAAMLSNKAEIDDSYSAFATKYKGRIIEFDGRIDYCTKHGDYNTRFDYLVSAGDYDPDHQIGPSFKFEDVNYYDLNTDLDTVSVGLNVRIVAEVVSFNSNSGVFYLEPVSVTGR